MHGRNMQEKKEERRLYPFLREKLEENFLEERKIFLWGAVTERSSRDIVEKLLYLNMQDPNSPIYFFIHSPGGVISSGMAIYDTMEMLQAPVYTITLGMAASMGAVLFAAGKKGHRYLFPHARIMIHQPLISGQIIAPAIDLKIQAEEIKKTREELNRILAEKTGQPLEKIAKDTDRDFYMTAEEAISYGIADKIVKNIRMIFKN